MQLNRDFVGSGPNVAFSYAASQYWPKVLSVPAFADPRQMFSGHMLNGASPNMNILGSLASPVIFQFTVPANLYFLLTGFNMVMVDAGISASKFGGITGGIANGLIWKVVDETGALVFNFHSGASIRFNYEFSLIGASSTSISSGSDQLSMNMRASELGGFPLLKSNWKVQMIVQDDLTSIDAFQSTVLGYYAPADVVLAV